MAVFSVFWQKKGLGLLRVIVSLQEFHICFTGAICYLYFKPTRLPNGSEPKKIPPHC